MRVAEIRVYQVDLPLVEGSYGFADGKSVQVFDSTVVEVVADDGRSGFGEACPLGPVYLPAFAAGVRAAMGELAPALIGADPREAEKVNLAMDRALMGHPYAKSPLDIACWDLAGQSLGVPLCTLLGGRFGERLELYRAIGQNTADRMAESVASHREGGYRKFQLKVGGDVAEDIARTRAVAGLLSPGETLVADANCGWLPTDASRVVKSLSDLDVHVEQPCAHYGDCLAVRRRTPLPFLLDETIDGVPALLRAHADLAMDAVNLKIGKVGGITRARRMRDICVALGIPMTIEDTWGGDIATAAIAHLAHSTPERLRFSTTDFNSYVTVRVADGAPRKENGTMAAPDRPGLGITPDREALGKAVARYP